MALDEYKRKRDFTKTPEPGPSIPEREGSTLYFCVQKHLASHLHYDFRLEFNGVLLSWAVPKGPSLDPKTKRLAMQTEDHPFDYGDFEGVIPEGYGAGIVMLWDKGTWTPEVPDIAAALKKGDLKFTLHGEKLKGSWVLVRTKGWGGSSKPSWLLIKHRDDFASDEDVAESRPRSVVSNRLLTQIAIDEGGDVEKASTGDPIAEVEKLLANPKLLQRKQKDSPAIWHSRPRGPKPEENEEKISLKVKRRAAVAAASTRMRRAGREVVTAGRPPRRGRF